jgi:protein ImuA
MSPLSRTVSPQLSCSEAPTSLEELQQKLALFEQQIGLPNEDDALALDVPAIDAAVAGGLARAALHEISACHETDVAAATRFVLGLAAVLLKQTHRHPHSRHRSARANIALWIAEDLCLLENGAPYGPGLVDFGIAPEQLITVAAPRSRDVFWAMEEALRCRATGVVIGEIRTRALDQVVARRLSLAAAAGNTLGLLLRPTPDEAPCACATRWTIRSAPSALLSATEERVRPTGRFRGIGPPRLAVHLVRNRHGHPGAWLVEWNSVEQRFELATDFVSMAGAAFDRPPHAAVG